MFTVLTSNPWFFSGTIGTNTSLSQNDVHLTSKGIKRTHVISCHPHFRYSCFELMILYWIMKNIENSCSSTMQISSEPHIITTMPPPRMELNSFDVRQRNCHFRRCNVSRLRKRPKDGNVLSSWQIFEFCWVCTGSMQSYACCCTIVINVVYPNPKFVDSEFFITVFGSRMKDSKDWYHWLQWSWNCAKISRNWHAFWRLCAKHGG